jgi:4-alpha-glucanotransferase
VLARTGYHWWVERFRRALELVDVARVDHFRGFQAYWEVDAREATAMHGRWVRGPGVDLFREVERRLGPLPLIAEDLGIITPDVEQLRDELGFPGMRVLQFAFDGDPRNPHLPANYPRESVAYTGTHDNNTILGWWASVGERERWIARATLDGAEIDQWRFIEEVMASRALLAVVPLQDVLGLGSEARMNTPGEPDHNWSWRLEHPVPAEAGTRLRQITMATGRSNQDPDPPEHQRPESDR